jgi:hypothetical protein
MKASEIAEGITMTRIVCVGITVLDRIWYLDDLPKKVGNMSQKTIRKWAAARRQRRQWRRRNWARKWILLAGWVMTIPADGCSRSWNPWGEYPLHARV